jgi:RimJ/RimL family protein N-acetyltransferase
MPERFIEPVSLEGSVARLIPLERAHVPALAAAAGDGRLWELFYVSVPAPEGTLAYVDAALDGRDRLGDLPFAVIEVRTGDVVGCTRYFRVEPANRRLEIGYTWYAERVQRTAVNTECKLMLLTHAFEHLGCIAVEFRTDWFNQRSQRAIERLGAHRDGVLRNAQIMPDGRIRDSVVYSIIDREWPAVKRHLELKLRRRSRADQPVEGG